MQILIIVRNRCIRLHVGRCKNESCSIQIIFYWRIPTIGRIICSFRKSWGRPLFLGSVIQSSILIYLFYHSRRMMILRIKFSTQILILLIPIMSLILRRQLAGYFMIKLRYWSSINRLAKFCTLSLILIISWWN